MRNSLLSSLKLQSILKLIVLFHFQQQRRERQAGGRLRGVGVLLVEVIIETIGHMEEGTVSTVSSSHALPWLSLACSSLGVYIAVPIYY